MQLKKNDGAKYKLRLYPILILGLLLLLGAVVWQDVLIHPSKPLDIAQGSMWAGFFRELAVAMIISVAIANTIDRVSRQEFNELVDKKIGDIQKDVFRSTYGRAVPDGLINEIERLVLDVSFLRFGHRITYQFTHCKARDMDPTDPTIPDIEVFLAEVSLTYEVENISSVAQPYDLLFNVEKPPFGPLHRFVRIESVAINGVETSGRQLEDEITSTAGTLSLSRTLPNILPGERVRVRGAWRTIKLPTDVELWKSLLPSDGMTLCAHFPAGTEIKDASAVHRMPITTRHRAPLYCEWSIEGPVLPLQGIIFWWQHGSVHPCMPASISPASPAAEPHRKCLPGVKKPGKSRAWPRFFGRRAAHN